jgi:RNA polymerase sigma-70 factor (ECF subfamily)
VRSGHPHLVQERAPSEGRVDADATDFDETYRRHVGFVWRTLRGMGVPPDAVEDATHEVFVVVHRRWADWDRRSRMTTWLYGIARGIARNVLRGRRRADQKLQAVRHAPASDSGRFVDPSKRVDRSEAAQLLEAFLGELDVPKRRVFVLCEVEGMSTAEAARCLRENPNTVATRLRRARKQFDAFVDDLNARSA